MGRATSGVTGMRFRDGDRLLAMSVVQAGTEPDVFVVFENGLAKRTPTAEYRLQGRGGTGIQVAKLSDKGGELVGALTVTAEDEVMVVMEKGKIVRSRVDEVRHTGRSTMGVKFATPDRGDAIVAVARNADWRWMLLAVLLGGIVAPVLLVFGLRVLRACPVRVMRPAAFLG